MIDSNKKRLNLLKTALPHKLEHWFQDCMSIRNYKGTLEVNDNTGVINIKARKMQPFPNNTYIYDYR
jgi:hypothetical protein